MRTRCRVSNLQSCLMTSMMPICSSSSIVGIWSNTCRMYSTAFGMAQFERNTNAFRLHVASDSAARNVWMSSGASGIRCSCWR